MLRLIAFKLRTWASAKKTWDYGRISSLSVPAHTEVFSSGIFKHFFRLALIDEGPMMMKKRIRSTGNATLSVSL